MNTRLVVRRVLAEKQNRYNNENSEERQEKEAPIQASNVAILNPETNKADRVGFAFEEGKKQRVFKSTGKPVDA